MSPRQPCLLSVHLLVTAQIWLVRPTGYQSRQLLLAGRRQLPGQGSRGVEREGDDGGLD
jgi:hypothetical protein